MPPSLALLLSALVTLWLVKKDQIPRPEMNFARWLVLLWLMIRASRPVTSWYGGGGDSEMEGNQTEALIMLLFFISAAVILMQRGFHFGSLPRLNIFFCLLLLYFGISCIWSPYSFVSLKRWSKEIGAVLVALLIVTDVSPAATFKMICVRSAYVLFPLSEVLIKYFPHLGRAYSVSGEPMVTGVTDQKNSLGLICCIFSLGLIWDLYDAKVDQRFKILGRELRPQLVALGLGGWLLWDSQSKTSLLALVAGIFLFFGSYIPTARRSPTLFAGSSLALVYIALLATGLSTVLAAPLLQAVGRDATLTGRTEIWQAALAQPTDPLIGSGFYIFWNEYGPAVWSHFQGNFYVRSVHSGYIETYLDGGAIGCTLLGAYIFILGAKLARIYDVQSSFSRVAFSLFVIFVITNFSEVYVLRLGSLWFLTIALTLIPTDTYRLHHRGLTGASG